MCVRGGGGEGGLLWEAKDGSEARHQAVTLKSIINSLWQLQLTSSMSKLLMSIDKISASLSLIFNI